jgi:hypothetical protein
MHLQKVACLVQRLEIKAAQLLLIFFTALIFTITSSDMDAASCHSPKPPTMATLLPH